AVDGDDDDLDVALEKARAVRTEEDVEVEVGTRVEIPGEERHPALEELGEGIVEEGDALHPERLGADVADGDGELGGGAPGGHHAEVEIGRASCRERGQGWGGGG